MLNRAHQLCQPISLFLNGADDLFGPITTLQKNGHIVKRIPWTTFKLLDDDWVRVVDMKEILEDANNIQQVFSSEKEPTLWRALPALEKLLSAWEKKRDKPRFSLYEDALTAGIEKIVKYYLLLDERPAFVLALCGEVKQEAE
ncbi:hypothetical protein H0H92_008583 [Tricholoma furcatifolium]|nr:hypothetical protein H0H92_008583 [Tricholoma furcatifolium]